MARSALLVILLLLLPSASAGVEGAARDQPPEPAAPVMGGVPDDMQSLLPRKLDAVPPEPHPASAPASLSPSASSAASMEASCEEDNGTLVLPTDCSGRFNATTYQQEFRFEVPAATTLVVNVSMTNTSYEWHACFYHPVEYGGFCRSTVAGERLMFPTAVAGAEPRTLKIYGYGGKVSYRVTAYAHPWALGPDCATGADSDSTSLIPIAMGAKCDGFLNPVDDLADAYSLTLGAGEAATITLQPNPEADFDMCARDAAGVRLACAVAPYGEPDLIYLSPREGGAFALDPRVWDGAEDYTLTVAPAAPQDDCGLGGDGGDAFHAIGMPDPFTCAGRLDPSIGDAWDVYSLTAPNGSGLRVQLNVLEGDATACIYPPNGYTRCTDASGAVAAAPAPDGMWYVGIRAREATSYEAVVASFEPTPQDDCGAGRDAPWGFVGIQMPGSCEGVLYGDEDDTWDGFTFELPDARVRFTISAPEGVDYCLQGPHGMWCHEAAERPERVVEALGAGQWNLSIRTDQRTQAAYSFAIELSAPRDDCGTGRDAAGAFRPKYEDARPLPLPAVRCEAAIVGASYDYNDAYLVTLAPLETLLVAFEGDTYRLQACIRTLQGQIVECTEDQGWWSTQPTALSTTSMEGGTFLVTVQWERSAPPAEAVYHLSAARSTGLTQIPNDVPLP